MWDATNDHALRGSLSVATQNIPVRSVQHNLSPIPRGQHRQSAKEANFRHLSSSHLWTLSHFSRHRPPSGSIVSADSQTAGRRSVFCSQSLPTVVPTHAAYMPTIRRRRRRPVSVTVSGFYLQGQFHVFLVRRQEGPSLV